MVIKQVGNPPHIGMHLWLINQITALNNGFTGSGFSFNLVKTIRTKNSKWRNIFHKSEAEYQMKKALRRGSYNALNLYLNSLHNGELLGYA